MTEDQKKWVIAKGRMMDAMKVLRNTNIVPEFRAYSRKIQVVVSERPHKTRFVRCMNACVFPKTGTIMYIRKIKNADLVVRGGVKVTREYIEYLESEIERLKDENNLKNTYLKKAAGEKHGKRNSA